MDAGQTEAQAVEAIAHLAFCVGWPNALSAWPAAKEVFQKRRPYGKNIHTAFVSRVEGGGGSELWLDWVENHQPFLLSRLTESSVSTNKVLCHATAIQI